MLRLVGEIVSVGCAIPDGLKGARLRGIPLLGLLARFGLLDEGLLLTVVVSAACPSPCVIVGFVGDATIIGVYSSWTGFGPPATRIAVESFTRIRLLV